MHQQRMPQLLVALLGLLILALVGLLGCASPRSDGSPPEPNAPTEVLDLLHRCADLEVENAELRRQTADLKRQHEKLKREKDDLAIVLEIAKERGFVGWITEPKLPPIETTVESVNRELQYVMLAAGAEAKVVLGHRFFIRRKGRYVGEVRVDWVSPKSSSASFVRIAPGMMFEVGDQASSGP